MEPLAIDDPAEIGGYRLRARLGTGGMGRVYLASTRGGRPVALKVVHGHLGDDQNFRARFRQEIQAAQRVHGLYTAELLDAGPDATPPWLVTAYVAGPSLADAVADHGPMPSPALSAMMAGVAEALQVIHAAGLVHRDLKPSNVLLSADGPRVIDFGIARALEGISLTHSGVHVGSPQFMAPEQIRALPATPAIDVFALGSLAAFALTGRPPFGDDNAAAVMHRVLWEPPDLDGGPGGPATPPGLRGVIEDCLAKQPEDRPQAAEIIEACRAQSESGSAPSGSALTGSALTGSALAWPPVAQPGLAETIPSLAVAPQPGLPPAGGSLLSFVPGAVPLMCAAGALAVVSVIVGLATLPALRSMLQHQHPAASGPAVRAAAGLAVAILLIRGLASAVMWLWAAAAARVARPQREVRLLAAVALGISALGVTDSYLQVLSTPPVRLVGLGVGLAGLGAAALLWRRAGS